MHSEITFCSVDVLFVLISIRCKGHIDCDFSTREKLKYLFKDIAVLVIDQQMLNVCKR